MQGLKGFYIAMAGGVLVLLVVVGGALVFLSGSDKTKSSTNTSTTTTVATTAVTSTPATTLKPAIAYGCYPDSTWLKTDGTLYDPSTKEVPDLTAYFGRGQNNITSGAFKDGGEKIEVMLELWDSVYCIDKNTNAESTSSYVVAKK